MLFCSMPFMFKRLIVKLELNYSLRTSLSGIGLYSVWVGSRALIIMVHAVIAVIVTQ